MAATANAATIRPIRWFLGMAAAKYGNRPPASPHTTPGSQGCHGLGGSSVEAVDRMLGADLHFHILPGVDDGPADLSESLELAWAAVADGTRTVVATPHVRLDLGITDAWEIHDRVRELRCELATRANSIDLRCGGELGHRHGRPTRPERAGPARPGPTGCPLAAGGDALRRRRRTTSTTPPTSCASAASACSSHTRSAAPTPLSTARPGLRRELDAGSLAQVNAQSLTGDHGDEAREAAWSLIADGLVTVVALRRPRPDAAPGPPNRTSGPCRRRHPAPWRRLSVSSEPQRLLDRGIRARRAVAA